MTMITPSYLGETIEYSSLHACRSTLEDPTSSLLLYVEDVDGSFDKAVKAGCSVKMPVSDQFWGDRFGVVTDPFGHRWSLATHVEDLTSEEVKKRAEEAFKQRAAVK